jgi:hypothetical protein
MKMKGEWTAVAVSRRSNPFSPRRRREADLG